MPQPIDMQTELGRTTMAERIQDAASRANIAAQQRAQVEEEEARLANESQVNETPETQAEHVDEEAKRKNPYAKKRKRGKSDKKSGKKAKSDTKSSAKGPGADGEEHKIDVRI